MKIITSKSDIHPQDYVVVVKNQQLYLSSDTQWDLYRYADIEKYLTTENTYLPVASIEKRMCYTLELNRIVDDEKLISLRSQMHLLSDIQYQLASRSLQLITWHKQHRFCGQCGRPTIHSAHELALSCESCKITYYPRISPCMMCLVTRGDECLLAYHSRYQKVMYSPLAGFVEAGESLEQTLHREVFEEVGLKVKNLSYFSSQSWPYPHQLMVGYFAEYKSGDLVLEESEIRDAQWFHYSQLPTIPPSGTLSGQLINAFVKSRQHSKKY